MFKRGCLQARKAKEPLRGHALHHNLIGPDVEARLPEIWRQLADKLWKGIKALSWGSNLPLQAVVTVEATGGNQAQPSSAVMPLGCSASSPSAAVVITAVTEEELE